MKHYKLSLEEIRSLSDDEYIELAASALWLEERTFETVKAAVNQAIGAAFGEKS